MRWISEWLFKEHIEQIVEDKFQEKLLETYLYTRKQELQQRIEKVRSTLDTQAHGITQNTNGTVLPSSNIRRSNSKSNIQVTPNTPLSDAEKMKQKLMGIK
jgi:F420-0:gamma-glutamyl ligase